MTKVPCPKCKEPIDDGAVKCPHCQSDLSNKSFVNRLLGAKEYVTLLAAFLALFTAYFDPISKTVLSLFSEDGARISGYTLNNDVINIGSDDERYKDRLHAIINHEYLARFLIINSGYSLASLNTSIVCGGSIDEVSKVHKIYTFITYNPDKQVKLFTEIGPKTEVTIFGNFDSANDYSLAEFSNVEPYKCNIGYADKYELRLSKIAITPDQLSIFGSP